MDSGSPKRGEKRAIDHVQMDLTSTSKRTRILSPSRDIAAKWPLNKSPAAGPWTPSSEDAIEQLSKQMEKMKITYPDTFELFAMLPPEIRILVWRHTWNHREVSLRRTIVGWKNRPDGAIPCTHRSPEAREHEEFGDIRALDARRAARRWAMNAGNNNGDYPLGSNIDDDDVEASVKDTSFITSTWTDSQPPITLFVNQESRHETLRYFEHGALNLIWGESRVWINFDLDVVHLPIHSPLHMAFTKDTLARLVRVAVPELAPALQQFAIYNGRWDAEQCQWKYVPPSRGLSALYHDFDRVWRLLRWRFPNLREIDLGHFHACGKYNSTKWLGLRSPLDLKGGTGFSAKQVDQHCHSCFNLQARVRTGFPVIGLPNVNQDPQQDLARILDSHDIMEPIYYRKQLVIGTVKSERKGEGIEDVTVNYWSIDCQSRENDSFAMHHPRQQTGCSATIERRIVAKTLERYLGCPSKHDYLAYEF
ncbi:hypothetical protein BJ170DRAFT_597551 [Xylariales sp. AK1849]|nr:hypothetical protein BJ170DRAFT_597551 [Xylariales sp. AK1849]